MKPDTHIFYNGSCPVCSREIAAYRRYSAAKALPLTFVDIAAADLEALGLTADQAARRLHVLKDGQVLAGVPAFLALWEEMPRLAWAARWLRRPPLWQIAEFVYETVLAPVLFAAHKRRQSRRHPDTARN